MYKMDNSINMSKYMYCHVVAYDSFVAGRLIFLLPTLTNTWYIKLFAMYSYSLHSTTRQKCYFEMPLKKINGNF